jgi:hypothetical protein
MLLQEKTNSIYKTLRAKVFILLTFSMIFHASAASQKGSTQQPDNLQFTYPPTPYNMNNQLHDMNFRTNALSPKQAPSEKTEDESVIIASAEPSILALQKVNTALSKIVLNNTSPTLNIIDLRREPHFFIHIINSPTITLNTLNGDGPISQFDLKPGWYSLSAKEPLSESNAIEMCNDNYSQIIQLMQPTLEEQGFNEIDAKTLFKKYSADSTMIHYDQAVSEKTFFEVIVKSNNPNFLGKIKYHHSCIKDFSSFTEKETNLLNTQINRLTSNHETIWVHCWGGQGRSSQYLGLYYFLQSDNQTAEMLLDKVQLFNHGKNMFEEPEQEDYVRQLGSKTQEDAALLS